MPFTVALAGFHFVLVGYLIWLHWFLIRRGLGVSAIRAATVLVVLIVAVSFLDTARYRLKESLSETSIVRYGMPYLTMHRADLFGALVQDVPARNVHQEESN